MNPNSPSIMLWKFYAIYCVFLVVAAFFSEGWQQPDEHARVLEAAHQVAYGYATLPWEFDAVHPIVSMLLGVLHAPLLMVTRAFSWSGESEASLMRAVAGLIASTRLLAFYGILHRLSFSLRYCKMGTLLYAVSIFGPMLFLRTSQENYATTALLWALYCLLSAKEQKSRWVLFGTLLSIAASFRLQVGFASLGLLIAFVMQVPNWLRWGKWVVGGLLLGLIPMAIVDTVYTGAPFTPAWNYLQYAVSNEGGGAIWGESPWYFYCKEYFLTWFPPFSLLLLPLILRSLWTYGFLLFPVFLFSFVHMVLGHKEVRYFTPMVPFFFLASLDGIRWACDKFRIQYVKRETFLRSPWFMLGFGIYGGIGLAAAFIPLNTSPRLYQELARQQELHHDHYAFTYVGNTRSGVSQFYYKHPKLPPPETWSLPKFFQWMHTIPYQGLAQPDHAVCHEHRRFALYALRFHELREVLQYCELEFVPLPNRLFHFLLHHDRLVATHRIHGIVRCPVKNVKNKLATTL